MVDREDGCRILFVRIQLKVLRVVVYSLYTCWYGFTCERYVVHVRGGGRVLCFSLVASAIASAGLRCARASRIFGDGVRFHRDVSRSRPSPGLFALLAVGFCVLAPPPRRPHPTSSPNPKKPCAFCV